MGLCTYFFNISVIVKFDLDAELTLVALFGQVKCCCKFHFYNLLDLLILKWGLYSSYKYDKLFFTSKFDNRRVTNG